jgi:hypothetical protein
MKKIKNVIMFKKYIKNFDEFLKENYSINEVNNPELDRIINKPSIDYVNLEALGRLFERDIQKCVIDFQQSPTILNLGTGNPNTLKIDITITRSYIVLYPENTEKVSYTNNDMKLQFKKIFPLILETYKSGNKASIEELATKLENSGIKMEKNS